MGQRPDLPPLPYRARPPQVLLGVGALLVVSCAAALAGTLGGEPARIGLLLAAAAAAAGSVGSARRPLPSSAETLAACAAALALIGGGWGGSRGADLAGLLAVAAGCGLLHLAARGTAAWPLAGWLAGQLAALRALPAVPERGQAALFLGVALAGLALALRARPLVARIALVTTAPWWVAGVVTGTVTAWTGGGTEREVAEVLLVAAAAGLLLLRRREDLAPLLRPPVAVPVLAGVVVGESVAASLAELGTPGTTIAGYAGILTAAVVPEVLPARRRVPYANLARAAGGAAAVLTLAQLGGWQHWTALCVLFLLTAVPTAAVALRQPGDRAMTVPVAIAHLALAVLCAVPARLLDRPVAAVVLVELYAAALLVAARLPRERPGPATAGLPGEGSRATAAAGGACAAAAVALLAGNPAGAALLLCVTGLLTLAWAGWETHPLPVPSSSWPIAAAQLTAAVWLAAGHLGVHLLEAWSLPLAAGLLLGAGPRLVTGPSWPAWAPGLLVAAVPSAVAAVLEPGAVRPVLVLVAAGLGIGLGGITDVRAPVLVGAVTAVGVGLGLAVVAAAWPLAGALSIGAVLLAAGTRGERFPVAGFADRLADLR